MSKFKVGDIVTPLENDDNFTKGKSYAVLELDNEGDVYIVDDNGERRNKYAYYFQLCKKSGKVIKENLERFMVYGIRCNNKSDLYETEKELKENLKKYAKDNDWNGRVIGYKLTPIYEAEEIVRLKIFKTVKIVKKHR